MYQGGSCSLPAVSFTYMKGGRSLVLEVQDVPAIFSSKLLFFETKFKLAIGVECGFLPSVQLRKCEDSTENTWKQVPRKDIALLLEFQQQSTAGLEGLNCKFKYVNAPPC